MRAANYFADTQPGQCTILGVDLLPLTAGHLIRLNQIESSFLIGATPTIEDLILSVLICSSTWDEGRTLLESPKLSQLLFDWQRRLTGEGWLTRLHLRKPRLIDWPGKFKLFEEYLVHHVTMPNVRFEPSEGQPHNIPMVLLVLNELESKSNWRRAELLDRPWQETLYDWLTMRVLSGQVQGFVTEDDVSDREVAEQIGRKFAEQLGILKDGGTQN